MRVVRDPLLPLEAGTGGGEMKGRGSHAWRAITVAGVTACFLAPAASAQSSAPGAPGASANWTTGNKQGLGTSVGTDSKVWYTLSNGALSEVYYPSGDRANVRSLEFAVTDGTSFVDRARPDTTHRARLV